MGKTLVIAEKPSVANDLTRALGKFEKNGDYFENERYVISSAIGHLVDDPIAPDGRLVLLAEGVVVVGRLGQGGEIGRLGYWSCPSFAR